MVTVLGIESSGGRGGVALFRHPERLGEIRLDLAGSHTERLLPAVDRLFRETGIDLSRIGGIAVSLGPGSFTGLRAGLGLGKGFAYTRGIDLVGIPTLDVLAEDCAAGPWILAVSDARRGEVFSALYRRSGEDLESCWPTRLGPAEDLAVAFREMVPDAGACLSVVADDGSAGRPDWLDPVLAALDGGGVGPALVERGSPAPGTVARLGARRLANAEKDDPMSLEPLYVRPSDAEKKRQP